MHNLTTTQRDVLDYVQYELRSMLNSRGDTPEPAMLDDARLHHLSAGQRDELGAKLMDLAKWILHL